MGLAGSERQLDAGCIKTMDSPTLRSGFSIKRRSNLWFGSNLGDISELASSKKGAGKIRSWCRTMTHRERGKGRKMPKDPESPGWCQFGLSWLPFYIVTRLEYWSPRRLVGSK